MSDLSQSHDLNGIAVIGLAGRFPGGRTPGLRDRLKHLPQSECAFVYLGRADASESGSPLFAPVPESAGPLRGPGIDRRHLLEISARLEASRLCISWTCSRNLHRRETIVALSKDFIESLSRFIAHGRERASHVDEDRRYTATALEPRDLDNDAQQLGRQQSL